MRTRNVERKAVKSTSAWTFRHEGHAIDWKFDAAGVDPRIYSGTMVDCRDLAKGQGVGWTMSYNSQGDAGRNNVSSCIGGFLPGLTVNLSFYETRRVATVTVNSSYTCDPGWQSRSRHVANATFVGE